MPACVAWVRAFTHLKSCQVIFWVHIMQWASFMHSFLNKFISLLNWINAFLTITLWLVFAKKKKTSFSRWMFNCSTIWNNTMLFYMVVCEHVCFSDFLFRISFFISVQIAWKGSFIYSKPYSMCLFSFWL